MLLNIPYQFPVSDQFCHVILKLNAHKQTRNTEFNSFSGTTLFSLLFFNFFLHQETFKTIQLSKICKKKVCFKTGISIEALTLQTSTFAALVLVSDVIIINTYLDV